MASIPALLFIGFVILQRLGELWLARRNTARLMARGAREVGAEHYPLIVALHASWIAALLIFGWQAEVSLVWLAVYAVLQAFRVWILASLGARWTTRIIILDEPLVRRGPYKFVSHPNYMLVVAEIFVTPMVLGLIWVAVLFTVLNGAMLALRISKESAALAGGR
ncbi:isoprenylcysteine carboxyl methyltransferase family protein [Devosia sp.]|uniref:isoprenylcysteine carboxyl methyltransferase family protein n=1 Tax=Devosia sp. TaxID=1871048 RepID=UPI003BABEC6F